jgi:hypothetical protein
MILAPGSLIAACDLLHPQASQCVLPHLEVDRWPSRISVESRRGRKTSRFDREVAIMTPWCEMVGRAAGSIESCRQSPSARRGQVTGTSGSSCHALEARAEQAEF